MKTECSDLKMSELSPNTTCHLCQGDVGSGDIVSIGEKGANRINKACVERGDDTHLTAGTGVHKSCRSSYTNKKLIYKHNKTKCVATPSRKRSVRISREPYDSTKVGRKKLRRAKSVLTTITIVVLEHLLSAKLHPFSVLPATSYGEANSRISSSPVKSKERRQEVDKCFFSSTK